MGLSFNEVNRLYSYTWVKCNDDARSSYFRSAFIQKHGGEFVKKGRYWEWNPKPEQMIKLDPSTARSATREHKNEGPKTWVFLDSDGTEHETKNIQEFCKQKDLTRSSLYEVISGKRKSHKGYSLKEIKVG